MKEVEILVEVFDNKKKILDSLKKFEFKGIKETKDIYFFHPSSKNLQVQKNTYPKEWFRIRKKNGKAYIAYKQDILTNTGKWRYSHEYETEIEDFNVMKQIIEKLGFKELVVIPNTKHTYETKDYEIVFEEVSGLGFFLEVEKLKVNDWDNIAVIRKEIQSFINNLGIKVSPELNLGKPELMLKKKSFKR
jgi:predicted adenylyl cyclase CyaB